jgi:hypothetical protein
LIEDFSPSEVIIVGLGVSMDHHGDGIWVKEVDVQCGPYIQYKYLAKMDGNEIEESGFNRIFDC